MFKIGDRVERIIERTIGNIGDIGTIVGFDEDDGYYSILWDKNIGGWGDEELGIPDGYGTFGTEDGLKLIKNIKEGAMTKEEFDEKYAGERIVVSCRTKDLANQFLILADTFGYKWYTNQRYIDSWSFENYSIDRYYWLYEGSHCGVREVEVYDLKVVEFDNCNIDNLRDKFNELDKQIKNISEVLKDYTPPKIEIGIRTEDLIKNLKDIQIRGNYKAEPTVEFIEKSMGDIIKSKIDDLHQEIEAFQMTIDEFREKIGNNLEKIEMLEEIIEDYEDNLECEEYEDENCGSVGDFNTDNYWRSPY